ncbi:class I lanthipeptide [Kordia sp.]|uniref:class I lanthipeptide n=1 Tax=Kordia sp. TaxID=1965332 RepID=UPI003D28CEAA
MKKRGIKNLNLNKRSISNLSNKQAGKIKGGTITTATIVSCWSCLSCPTIDCTEGEICSSLKCLKEVLEDVQ